MNKEKKKKGWVEYSKDLAQVPVLSPNFNGIVFQVKQVPLCRIGFTATRTTSQLVGGLPVLVPFSGPLAEAPEFIIRVTKKEIRLWVKGELAPPRIVISN